MIEYRVNLDLPNGVTVPVLIGRRVPADTFSHLPQRLAVVTDKAVFKLHGKQFVKTLQATGREVVVIELPNGEEHKTMQSVNTILDKLVAKHFHRDTCLLALGGGVIGDAAGFAASIYMRGIALVQVPTTLLAQVDAAIGGKTGVNHALGKNLIGTFYQPQQVVIDTALLSTLPAREYNAGLAEVVKYALLGDANFFEWLCTHKKNIIERDEDTVIKMIHTSVVAKIKCVTADEKETTGTRALLNLGHTFAHAIEHSTGYGTWLHGEAVAMGMVMAARLSAQIAHFPNADIAPIMNLLEYFKLPIKMQLDAKKMRAAMALDKKHLTDKKHFILMRGIGRAFQSEAVSEAELTKVLKLST